jgi:regulation of enolase protein 1 (concanavalin A-like superfamily)
MDWLNEPPDWAEADGTLDVVTGDRTDFWRKTHYGFLRDDGHFRHVAAPAQFSATVSFRGEYEELYDQAGLMLRLDEATWIKTGIEFVAGRRMLSAVVTRDFSDWSTMPMPVDAAWVRLRLTRIAGTVHVHWAAEPEPDTWRMLRLAWFPPGGDARVGPMCCSPQRAGFRVEFRDFALGPPAQPEEQ